MLSANDLIRIIKEAAVEAVRENDPADVHYGTIEEADPETGKVGTVRIDEQWELDADQVVTPAAYHERTVKKIKVKGDLIGALYYFLKKNGIDVQPPEGCGEDEALFDVTIKDFLQAGDAVIIMREQGGQRYVINGRVGNAGK